MRIVKLVNSKGAESFHQVVKAGAVQFDPRPGWLLLATPPGARPHKQELKWVHLSDRDIAWDRQFRFADVPDQ